MTLKHQTFSAVRWTTSAAIFRAVLQFVQIAVLARLLAPEDYGLMAMVTVVLGFAGMFADLGVNSAFVQRQDVSQEERSSLFWLNVAMSAGLSVLVVALSPMFAWFFNDARLSPLMMLSATTFVIGAFGLQVRMAAEKELDFRPVVLLEVTATSLGFIAALFTAFMGWAVYALVFGGIVTAVTGTVFAWLFIARGWRPLWRLRIEDVRPYLGFGGAIVANSIVNHINMSVDIFLGGRMLGAEQLGLYSIPRNLMLQLQMVVNPVITRVGFPIIAQVQHDVARVRSIYLKTLNMTASTNAPLYVGIAYFAPEIVTIMLGDGWRDAAPLLRILAVWGLFRSIANPAGSLLFGMGKAGLALRWNIALLFIVPPIIWLGSQYGPEGMAWSLLGLMIGIFIPCWYFLIHPVCQAGLVEYAIAAFRPSLLALLSITPAYILAELASGATIKLVIGVGVSIPLYFVANYMGNREWIVAVRQLIEYRKGK